ERRAARLAEGLSDPLDEAAQTPLSDHLDAYSKYLADKGNVSRHVKLTRARIAACLDACRFVRFRDIQPSAGEGFLEDLRRPKRVPDLPPDQDHFTVAEVAEVLGIQSASVYMQLRRARLPYKTQNGRRLVPRAVVEQMVSTHAAPRSVT